MAFVPFNNTIKLVATFGYDLQYCANVHHYIVDETPDAATATSLAEGYKTWWDTYLKAFCPSALALVRITCTIMENENDPVIEYTTGMPDSATNSEPALPNSVTVAVRWNTNFRGRSYKGRTFHLGLTETQVTGNLLGTSQQTILTTAYGELMAIPTDVGPAIMGVASYYYHGVQRTTGVITPVTSVFIDRTIDSQRRRLPGRGR